MTNHHQLHHNGSGTSASTGVASAPPNFRTPGLRARLVLAFLIAAGTLTLTAAPALAHVVGHRFERTFAGSGTDSLSNPTDVAVDNSTGLSAGDIYVTDPAAHRVEKFSSTGEFILMFGKEVNETTGGNVCTEGSGDTCKVGTGSSEPGGFQAPSFVAIDDSAGSTAGDVYVGDTGDHLVSQFNPSGEIVSSWGSAGQFNFPTISGLAVDRTGNLFVGTELKLFEYTSAGEEFRNCELPSPASLQGLAVDRSDSLYLLNAEGKVETVSDECTGSQVLDAATGATGLAINPGATGENDLYVDQGGTLIDHFPAGCSSACEPADSFGTGHLTAAQGIAIAASGTVYVADPGAAGVAVFPNHTLPDVSLTTRSNAALTAVTLGGHVDPDAFHGGSEVTACQFEYVDQSEFEAHKFATAATVPCSSTHFSNPEDVSAHITGLTPKLTYHYRLSASSSQGTGESEEQIFTSPTHVFAASFGAASSTLPNPYPLSEPSAVAVDNSSGPSASDVYVADTGNHRVEKFSPTGEFLLMFGKGVNEHGTTEAERAICTRTEECQPGTEGSSPGAFSDPVLIAVDPSSGPSAGDVYVGENGNYRITKFDPSGHIITAWGTEGQLTVSAFEPFLPIGLGVDDNGDVWTAVYHTSGRPIYEYSETGELRSTAGEPSSFLTPRSFAIGPSGETFYDNQKQIPGAAPAAAPNGFLYTIGGQDISAFEPSGKPFGEPFGFGALSDPTGLAIDGASNVYVADSGVDDVSVFDSVDPGPTTGPIESEEHTRVTITGEVDPLGHGEVTECRFEYVTGEQFKIHEYAGAATVPCSASHFSTPTKVTAELSGLTAESPYHYRIVAGNANGTLPGSDRSFALKAVLGVKTEAPTEVERTSATLNGSLNPDELPTHYFFEYVTDEQFKASGYEGAAKTPEAEISTSATEQSVSYHLSGLQPQTTYRYRLVAGNEDGTTFGSDEPFETLRAVFGVQTTEATEVLPGEAILHGTYLGDSEGGETKCDFHYGSDESYGHATEELDYGSASGSHPVEAKVTGLSPRNTYHFALVCANSIGTTVGNDENFETPEAPTVDGLSSSNLTKTSADLTAEINPQGFDTKYRFEYGTTTGYGTEVPSPEAEITGSPEELSKDHSVEVKLSGLQQGVVYHFRLVATNEWGSTATEEQTLNFYPPDCPNETLRQETNSSFLPDCRAYELVSPGNAGSVVLTPGAGAPSSSYAESPTRFAFVGVEGEIPGGDSPNSNGNNYIATRTPTGWESRYVGIRGTEGRETVSGFASNLSLEKFIDFARHEEGESPINAPYAWDSEGNPLGQWPQDAGSVPGGESTEGMFQPSPDFSHLAFSSSNIVFPTGEGAGQQPTHQGQLDPPGSAYDYDTGTGFTDLISVLPGGENIPQAPGYSSENPLRYILFPGESELTGRGQPSTSDRGVSTDGTHILMGLPGRQVFLKALGETPCSKAAQASCGSPGLMQLYMRVDDAVTYDVSKNLITDEPAEVEYVGMSSDGSKVYFISDEHLIAEDPDHGGTSLYMWSENGGNPTLTLISKGNSNSGQGNSADCHASWVAKCGITAVQTGSLGDEADSVEDAQTDNSIATGNGDIYFYSPEQLDGSKGIAGQMNLYDYRSEKPEGDELQYVTTVEPNIECPETYGKLIGHCRDAPITRLEVIPDDSHAAFVTSDQITSYNNTDPNGYCSYNTGAGSSTPISRRCQEMYSYDPTTDKIVCVSCNPSGAPPSHDVSASTQGLFMSSDGRTFFSTEEALVQTDTNEAEDVYEYVEGRPQLITTGTDAADKLTGRELGAAGIHGGLAGVSTDGINVYFSTRDTLVPQDENGQYIKFYDARTDGGFPFEKPAPPCESADECHGTGSSAPSVPHAGAAANLGVGGNATAEPHSRHRKDKTHKRKGKRHHRRSGRRIRRAAR